MIGKQSGQWELAAWGIEHKPGVLDEVNAALNWKRFDALLHKVFKASREGRPSYPPLVLFKVMLLQQWYGLSDPMAEEAIGDRLSFRRFLGLGLRDAVPDETTICRFRGRLAEKRLAERLLVELNRQLDGKGLLVKRGTLVDATLVAAQPRPPSKDDERSPVDADADWTVKRGRPTYGYKLHVGVDQDSGLIRTAELTPASTHDSKVFEPLLSGDERAVYADKAYDAKARRKRLKARGVLDGILKQARRNRPLTDWERTWNRYLSALRSPVERVFGTLKRGYGFYRARYVGLARNRNHALLLVLAFNMRKAVRLARAS
jgi:IS5 family transposase